jgi:hypothetical protein
MRDPLRAGLNRMFTGSLGPVVAGARKCGSPLLTTLLRFGLATLIGCAVATPWLLPRPAYSQDYHPILEYKENAQRARDKLEARWRRLPQAVKSLSYIESFTPFFSWINLCNATDYSSDAVDRAGVRGVLPNFLLGDCLEVQRIELWQRPYDEFVVSLSRALNSLWVRNPRDAIRFATAMVGRASDDVENDDAWSLAQIIIVPLMLALFLRSAIRTVTLKNAFVAVLGLWLVGHGASPHGDIP